MNGFNGSELVGGGDGVVLAALSVWAQTCGYPFTVDPDGDVDISCERFSVICGAAEDHVVFVAEVGTVPRHGWLWPFRYRRLLRRLLEAGHGLGYVYMTRMPGTLLPQDLVMARAVLRVGDANDESLNAGLRSVLSVAGYAQDVLRDG